MPFVERRRYPRLALNVDVEYRVLEQKDFETSHSKNISGVGICIILLDRVNAGTMLELNFRLPGFNKVITATGRVVWLEEFIVGDAKTGKAYDAGIEFVDITDEDRETVKQYVVERI